MQTTPRQALMAHDTSEGARWIWRLHIVCSADAQKVGQVLRLGAAAHTWPIGRAQDCDAPGLRFHDPLLSREHLSLTVHGDSAQTVTIEDRASTNGTYCNGAPVLRIEAGTGAVLRFGDTVAVLEADCDRAPEHHACSANMPGHSEVARLTRAALHAAAQRELPLLIVGQTGTGKEFAAAEVHRLSGRKGPLIRINTAAPPDSLFESELFGAAAGAYTGAQKARRGRIAEADGGTFVLDEIGELPMAQQAKLLRVLEEGLLRPLGASADQSFDVRFVASTNADLERRVAEGRFRADLLARLRGSTVALAPLRDRRADLLDFADAVAPLPSTSEQRPQSWRRALPAELIEALLLRGWPYNLRELRSVLHELLPLLGDQASLARWLRETERSSTRQGDPRGELDRDRSPGDDLRDASNAAPSWGAATPRRGTSTSPAQGLREWPPRRRRAPRPEEMRALLRACEGNIEAMARELGCARRQVYRWLEAAELDQAAIDAVREETR